MLKLQVEGTVSAATVRGSATPLDANLGGEIIGTIGIHDPDFSRAVMSHEAVNVSGFWSHGGVELPPVFPDLPAPLDAWSYDVAVRSEGQELTKLLLTFDLRLLGKGAAPELTGSIAFRNARFIAGEVPMRLGSGSVTWRDGGVFIDARAVCELHGFDFVAHVLGPIGMPLRFFEFSPPLSETVLIDALAGHYRAVPSLETATRFAFHAPWALIGDVQVFDWTIADPPAAEPK